MWKCKKCGTEIIVRASVPTRYRVFLDKDCEIEDFDDYGRPMYYDAEITSILCIECGDEVWNINDIKDIAYWEE